MFLKDELPHLLLVYLEILAYNMTSLIGVGLVAPVSVLVVLDLVPGLEGQVIVLDLVIHVVLHLALVVLEGLAVLEEQVA